MQSGDILLCAGNGKFSKRIQTFQRLTGAPKESAMLSHVASICGSTMVLESTTLNKWANKRGVQANDFEPWLENYDGHVWVRHLDFPRPIIFYTEDASFIETHIDDDYENGIPGAMELFLCGLRLNRFIQRIFPKWKPKFTDEPHCTELIAKRLEYHNLWNAEWFKHCAINRLPPWVWWSDIDKYLTCPISKPEKLK